MKAVALLSAGMDSPVAIYLMLRKGFEVVPIHFVNGERENYTENVLAISGKLKKYGLRELIFAKHSGNLENFKGNRHTCILCKRMMFRISERTAEQENAEALITGESVSSKASQTLENMRTISSVCRIRIIRPLLGFSKPDVERISRKLGILPDVSEQCAFAPSSPRTLCSIEEIEGIEKNYDLEVLAKKSLESMNKCFI